MYHIGQLLTQGIDIIHKLLSELEQALSDREYTCCDYRFPMHYVPGMTLKT